MTNQRWMSLAALLVVSAVSLAQTKTQTPPADTKAAIQGVVTRAGTGQPLKRARVTLRRSDQQQRAVGGAAGISGQVLQQIGQRAGAQIQFQIAGNTQAVTDDNGQFMFNGVEPGQYRISADREGYVRQEYGQRTYEAPGTILTLSAGQHLTNVDFQMSPAGVVAGRVFNEDGEPLAGVQVQAQIYGYIQGKKTLTPSGQTAQTNDLGEYRIYWLPPGEYYISATARRGLIVTVNPVVTQEAAVQRGGGGRSFNRNVASLADSDEAYAPTYFPGTINPESASPVSVPAAAEIRGIDFGLRPTPTVQVSGRILLPVSTGQNTAPAPAPQPGRGGAQRGPGGRGSGPPVTVMLTRNGARGGFPGGNRVSVQQDGSFQINGVIPGAYSLVAVARQDNQQYSGRMKLGVVDRDIDNLSIPLRAGISIPGRIFIDGTPPATFKMSQLRVAFTAADDFPGIGNNSANAQVADDGTFTLPNVAATDYRVRISGLPQGGYLNAGRIGSADAVNEPFAVTGDQQVQIQLQIGFSAGHVQGTAVDAKGNVVPGVLATLVPDESRRQRADIYFSSATDSSGRYSFPNVPPGNYRLFAWEDIPSGAWQDPDFLRRFEDRGKPVQLSANGSIDADALVISIHP